MMMVRPKPPAMAISTQSLATVKYRRSLNMEWSRHRFKRLSPTTSVSVALCLLLVLQNLAFSAAWYLQQQPTKTQTQAFANPSKKGLSRRDWVEWQVASAVSASSVVILKPSWASAAGAGAGATTADNIEKKNDDGQKGSDSSASGGLLSAKTVAHILHVVPTFTIVDAKGVPYMVVGEDAQVTGYFFSTYEEANRILTLARTSADKAIRQAKLAKEPVDENPWTKARISTVPLDVAVTIVAKSLYTRSHFQIAPAQDDVEDALAITGKKDLAEGKVPLFYMKDFTIEDPNNNNERQSPLYFRKSELVQAYKRQHPKSEDKEAEILVTELFAVVLEMVKPGGNDEELKTLILVPPKGSEQRAHECNKAGGKEPPFALGQRNLVL